MMSSGLARVGALIAGSPSIGGAGVRRQQLISGWAVAGGGGEPGPDGVVLLAEGGRWAPGPRSGMPSSGPGAAPVARGRARPSTSGSRPSEVARSMASGMVWTGPAGTPAAVSRCTHESGTVPGQRGLERRHQRLPLRDPGGVRREVGVLGEVGHTDDLGEPGELAVVAARHRDEPVGAPERLVGRDARVPVAHPARGDARLEGGLPLVDHRGERAGEEADLDPVAAAGPLPGGRARRGCR